MPHRSAPLLLIVMALLLVFITACGNDPSGSEGSLSAQEKEALTSLDAEKPLTIYTTLFPLYDFARKIAGERGHVVNLVPPGVEPHEFEPTAQDLAQLHQADLFIYNGGGFEGWIETVLGAVNNPELTIVDSSEGVELLTMSEVRSAQNTDPHIWLDPLRAKRQAEAIKAALIEIDPAHQELYEQNFIELAQAIDHLHAQFAEMAEHLSQKDFVVSHQAFGYLADRYGLNQISISGLSPSQEPDIRRMQEVIQLIREQEIKYILFENNLTPRVAEVIKAETGADSLVLHTLESLTEEELAQGEDYISLMEHNLEMLKIAMGYRKE